MIKILQCPKVSRKGNVCRGRLRKAGFDGGKQRYECVKCRRFTVHPIVIKRDN